MPPTTNGDQPVTRVTLRPLGSTLPLGALTLVPAGTLLAGLQLGWFPANEAPIVAYVLLGFAVPLQLVASVLAFLARDSLVGTGFAVFTGIWLAFGLTTVSGSVGETSRVLPLLRSRVPVAVAGYVGLATLLEDNAHRLILPIGRRGAARAAIDEGYRAQLGHALEREAGVREQL